MKRLMALLVTTGFLTACSNDDAAKAELNGILACSMAAKLVGRADQIDLFAQQGNIVAARTDYELTAEVAGKMHADIKAKWNLKSLSRHDQDVLLVDVYNSKTCAAVHHSRPITIADVPPDA